MRQTTPSDVIGRQPSVATGRFFFRKKTLTYSFVASPEFGLPKLITFLDNESNIIEEFPVQMTTFQVRPLQLESDNDKIKTQTYSNNNFIVNVQSFFFGKTL
jgi:hypothetical protein